MIFKSKRVKKLERLLDAMEKQMWENLNLAAKYLGKLVESNNQLEEMTECRDAVAAASKFLRDRCDMQDAVLKLIAVYGEKHPECCARIAKAAVKSE